VVADASPAVDPGPPGDPESVARIICLRALNQRARTRSELADLLNRKGVPDDAASLVLNRFAEVGLIDDASLAESFAAAAHSERGLSRRAVALRLRRRGIDEPIVQGAVAQIDDESEYAAARSLVLRRGKALTGLATEVQARRLVALLGRRGYPPSLAFRVVQDVLDTWRAQPAEPVESFESPLDSPE
jgi:regulatory protein